MVGDDDERKDGGVGWSAICTGPSEILTGICPVPVRRAKVRDRDADSADEY